MVNSPELLALEHINSEKPTTLSVLNKIFLNQNIVVNDLKLDQLLKVKGVEVDLTDSTPENLKLLAELTGKSAYKGFSGVYMFIHKNTGYKYVGSSNLLRRRIDFYFKVAAHALPAYTLTGKFLPLLNKEGLEAFKLIIFKLDSKKFIVKDALILEQFFLLNKDFNLNTLRVVNAGPSKGSTVYVYDLTCSTLYYQAKSKIELKRILKIHPDTCNKFLDSKLPYLNNFFLLSYPIPTASNSNTSREDLLALMQKERKATYAMGTRRSIPIELVIKKGNTFVSGKNEGCTLNFDSVTSCKNYLRELGITIKGSTLIRYIKSGKVFHNFLCKYSDKLPDDFKQAGLIMDEFLKSKTDNVILKKINRKNKPLTPALVPRWGQG